MGMQWARSDLRRAARLVRTDSPEVQILSRTLTRAAGQVLILTSGPFSCPVGERAVMALRNWAAVRGTMCVLSGGGLLARRQAV